MKNENKCFFSISLENGITITGDNPIIVKEFIVDMQVIMSDALKVNQNNSDWNGYIQQLRKYFDHAWITIYNNYNRKD